MRAAMAVSIAAMDRTGRSLKAGAGTGSMPPRATLFKTGHGISGQGPRLELVPEPRLPTGRPVIGFRTGQTPDNVRMPGKDPMPGKDRTRANVRTMARGPMPAKGRAIKDQMSSGQPTGRRRARLNVLPNAPRPGQHSGRKHRHISIETVRRARPVTVRSTVSATCSGPGRNRPARNAAAVAAPPAEAAAAGGKGGTSCPRE